MANAGEAIIIVDPISSGANLAQKCFQRGFEVIALWSLESQSLKGIGGDESIDFTAELYESASSLSETLEMVQNIPCKIVACMVGCESGVELNDFITEQLCLPSNGSKMSYARRDKFNMQTALQSQGIRSIMQCTAETFEEVKLFVEEAGLNKWVMKPRRDAASCGVFVCESIPQAQEAFQSIMATKTVFGEENKDVLVQEFLDGSEYVVDTVSCEGVHKVAALWKYEKHAVNGAPAVYFRTELFHGCDEGKEEAIMAYVFKVCDALEIKYGPCHAEVIWLERENAPCLVEIGARAHGGAAAWADICDEIIGYNQHKLTIDCYLDPEAFFLLPKCPTRVQGNAIQFNPNFYEDGLLENVNFQILEQFDSFRGFDMHCKVGSLVEKTINLITSPGVIKMANRDKDKAEKDAQLLREKERALFKISPVIHEPFKQPQNFEKERATGAEFSRCDFADEKGAVHVLPCPEALKPNARLARRK